MTSGSSFCPYIGLQPYTEADREFFFGRDRDTRSISSNLYAAPLTVLYGASGVGKSSVLLAGVVPHLRAASRTAVVMFREWQGPSFLNVLKRECLRAVELAGPKAIHISEDLPFDELLAAAAQALGGTLLILFDQFEEYSLYHPESDRGNPFDAEFARAVNRLEIQAHFLIALREDGLSGLDRFRTRIPNLLANRLRLQHLDKNAAEEAIRRPLDVYNSRLPAGAEPVGIEDELVKAVIEQVCTAQGSLSESGGLERAHKGDGNRIEAALLQLVMTRLWREEAKDQSAILRRATLDFLKGAGQIVKKHLDEEMDKFSEEEREIASRMFRLLVTSSGAKIAQETDVLASFAECPPVQAKAVLAKLASSHILNRISDSERYEIFHDVLGPAIKEWRTAQQLAEAEKRAALEAAEQARQAARQQEEQRRLNRRRKLTAALSGMLVVMASLAVLALVSWRSAERNTHEAHALRLAAASQAKLLTDAKLALLLAQVAVSETRLTYRVVLPEAELALRQAVQRVSAASSASGTIIGSHGNSVYELTFTRDGKLLASASSDNTVKVWDLSAGKHKEMYTLSTPAGQSVRLTFSSDGRRLAMAVGNHSRRIWDASTGKELTAISTNERASGEFFFGRELNGLKVESLRGTANVRDIATNRILFAFRAAPAAIGLVASSRDGKLLALSSDDGTIRVWDIASRTEVSKLSGHRFQVLHAAFSSDGNRLATADLDPVVKVWDIPSRRQLYSLTMPKSGISGLALSADGTQLAIGGSDGNVTVGLRQGVAQAAAFGPDGTRLVVSGQDGTLKVVNRSSGEELISIPGPPVRVLAAALSSSGMHLAVSTSAVSTSNNPTNLVKILEVPSGIDKGTLPPFGCAVLAVAFNPDGTRLATACAREMRVWDVSSGQELGQVSDLGNQFYEFAFSSDGNRLAGASVDGTARIWDVSSGQELGQVSDLDSQVYKLALSSEGTRLAAASPIGTVRVWDTSARTPQKPLSILPRDRTEVLAINFTPDLKRLATIGQDGIIREDSLDIQEPMSLAQDLAKQRRLALTLPQCGEYHIHSDRCEALELDAEGRKLAHDGKLSAAITKFKKARALDQTLLPNGPEPEAKRLVVGALRAQGKTLALNGNVAGATEKFQEAKSLDSSLKIDPQTEPKRLLAQARRTEGGKLARDGDIAAATQKFQEAKSLDFSLIIDPQAEVKRVVAQTRVREGRKLARDGDIAAATQKFQEAKSLDSSLKIDPQGEAMDSAVQGEISKGLELAEKGNIRAALRTFLNAQKLDPTKIDAESWNALCWDGSLWGYPLQVLNACEKAVELTQGDMHSRDSRGLARALTLDKRYKKGAIEDFEFYVEHADNANRKLERQRWIAALRQGNNPFTPDVLKALFSEGDIGIKIEIEE